MYEINYGLGLRLIRINILHVLPGLLTQSIKMELELGCPKVCRLCTLSIPILVLLDVDSVNGPKKHGTLVSGPQSSYM